LDTDLVKWRLMAGLPAGANGTVVESEVAAVNHSLIGAMVEAMGETSSGLVLT